MQKIIRFFILTLLIFLGCKEEKKETIPTLSITSDYGIDVPEPSGLTLSHDGRSLWTVSDQDSYIYNITKTGRVLHCFQISGRDLEGIVENSDSTLLVVLESTQEVVEVTTSGKELRRVKTPFVSKFNKGLEGITFSRRRNSIFVVNEKEPKLFAEFDLDFNLLNNYEIEGAGDFSGICVDDDNNKLWILSDENQMVYHYDYEGRLLDSLKIDLTQAEGIAYDSKEDKLYIISDPLERLYIYQF